VEALVAVALAVVAFTAAEDLAEAWEASVAADSAVVGPAADLEEADSAVEGWVVVGWAEAALTAVGLAEVDWVAEVWAAEGSGAEV
jgi:hypothetical protein